MSFLLALLALVANPTNLNTKLAEAKGGDTITLEAGSYGPVTIKQKYDKPVTIVADKAQVKGVSILNASNIIWRGGVISSRDGNFGFATAGYGVYVRNASDVTIDNAQITSAKKALVGDTVQRLTINNNRFIGYGEDGAILSMVKGLTVTNNVFTEIQGRPTECTTPGGVLYKLSKAACTSFGGTWKDGFHADAVQMRNGVEDALIERNVVLGDTQGLTQMDTTGDAPLKNITVRYNVVYAGIHHISLGGTGCINCKIENNIIRRYLPTSNKAVIRQGPAARCGNDVPDDVIKDRPCS